MRTRLSTASCWATSTRCPTPVVWRWTIAARMPMARWSPAPVSPSPASTRTGGPSAARVTLIAPPMGLGDHLEVLVVGVRPAAAEALDRGRDDPRIDPTKVLVPEPEPLHRARTKVLDEDVGALDHPREKGAPFGRFEVERHALLVAVQQQEEPGIEVGPLRQCAAPRLAPWRLDLDDVGAEPRQHLGATRPSLVLREVEHHDPVERLGHVVSFYMGGLDGPPMPPVTRRRPGTAGAPLDLASSPWVTRRRPGTQPGRPLDLAPSPWGLDPPPLPPVTRRRPGTAGAPPLGLTSSTWGPRPAPIPQRSERPGKAVALLCPRLSALPRF